MRFDVLENVVREGLMRFDVLDMQFTKKKLYYSWRL